MSGGSFEYLCFKEIEELIGNTELIESMHKRLIELGFDDAASETAHLLLTLRQHQNYLQAMLDRMKDVWHAVEWYDSSDWGIAQVRRILWEYRGNPPCDHLNTSDEINSYMGKTDERPSGYVKYRECLLCGKQIIEE